jgi:hypothetical protein
MLWWRGNVTPIACFAALVPRATKCDIVWNQTDCSILILSVNYWRYIVLHYPHRT